MVLLRLHGIQETGNLHASRDAHKRENQDGNQEEDGQQAEIIEIHRGVVLVRRPRPRAFLVGPAQPAMTAACELSLSTSS